MWAAKEWIKKSLLTLNPTAELTAKQWDSFIFQPGNKAGILVDPMDVAHLIFDGGSIPIVLQAEGQDNPQRDDRAHERSEGQSSEAWIS